MEETINRTYTDSLTNLPNQIAFHDFLQQEITSASLRKESVAILLIDFFQLRALTDAFGSHFCSGVLQKAGSRLIDLFQEPNIVACFPENSFAVMAPMTGVNGAIITAQQIIKLFETPLIVDEMPVALTVKIGISVFPEHQESAETLIQGATAAMHTAANIEDDYYLYTPEDTKEAVYHIKLMGELPNAIASGQIVMYYQPKVNMATGNIQSVEALVRWVHPKHGFLLPETFIPYAEQSRCLQPITAWGIEATARQIKEWKPLSMLISMNLSAQDIQRRSLISQIAETIQRLGIPPHLLEIEITETAIITAYSMAQEVLYTLSEMGTSIWIDDFGVGYTSLKMLKNLPIRGIKLDKSLIHNLIKDKHDRFTVLALIDLAHHLELSVTAEGIENKETTDLLVIGGCDMGQGAYFGMPMSAKEITPILKHKFII